MNNYRMALTFGTLCLAATQASIAAEFTLLGDVTYASSNSSSLVTASTFAVVVTYEDDAIPVFSSTAGSFFELDSARWSNAISSMVMDVYDGNGNVLTQAVIDENLDGSYVSTSFVESTQKDYYSSEYPDEQATHYDIRTLSSNSSYTTMQVSFVRTELDLFDILSATPFVPTQDQIIDVGTSSSFFLDHFGFDTSFGEKIFIYGKITDLITTTDSDGDGVPDDVDAFPFDENEWEDLDGNGIGDNADSNDNSDYPTTVWIEGIDSRVSNTILPNGQTLADIITAASNSCKASAKNHGQYVSCIGKTLNSLRANGNVSDSDKGALQNTSAKVSSGAANKKDKR